MEDEALLRPYVAALQLLPGNATLRSSLEVRAQQIRKLMMSGVLPRHFASLPVLYPFSGLVSAVLIRYTIMA